jgi:hypothetical protein
MMLRVLADTAGMTGHGPAAAEDLDVPRRQAHRTRRPINPTGKDGTRVPGTAVVLPRSRPARHTSARGAQPVTEDVTERPFEGNWTWGCAPSAVRSADGFAW